MKRVLTFILIAAIASSNIPASANILEPAFEEINMGEVWAKGHVGAGATVAIIDQGVNMEHPYFEGRIVDGFCFVSIDSVYRCPNGGRIQLGAEAASQRKIGDSYVTSLNHGNMVAGLVAGQPNELAPGGVAPGAKILMANIDLTLGGVIAALRYIKERRQALNIVALSMSWGGVFTQIPREWLQCQDNPQLQELANILGELRQQGVMPFAAAGNSPTLEGSTSLFPACLNEVVSVASVDEKNSVSWYVTMSRKVEILAPDYATSADTFGYLKSSGTSAAAPVAAGVYAVLRQAFPSIASETVLSVMKSTGSKINDVLRKDIPLIDATAAVIQLEKLGTINPGQVLNVGTFNGKIVVYAKGFTGSTISWKIAGRWQKATVTSNFQAFDRITRAKGVNVLVDVYVNGSKVPSFSKTVLTK
ncbi:MAG: hypothetical protein RIR89_1158 [Actinomycetota bacterium]